jgi:hypothetical protein
MKDDGAFNFNVLGNKLDELKTGTIKIITGDEWYKKAMSYILSPITTLVVGFMKGSMSTKVVEELNSLGASVPARYLW